MARKIPGQANLDGIFRTELPADKQVSISRLISFQSERLDLAPVPERHLLHALPERLRPDLINLGKPGPASEAYQDGLSRKLIHVALTPVEYTILARSPERIGQAALNRTLASRYNMPSPVVHASAAGRSKAYALEGYFSRMEKYRENNLRPNEHMLERVKERLDHPNLRRNKGSDMRQEIDWVYQNCFGEMISALSIQRQWVSGADDNKAEKREAARAAIDYRLYGENEAKNRIQNWKGFIGLANDWNNHKIALFSDRIWRTRKQLNELQ